MNRVGTTLRAIALGTAIATVMGQATVARAQWQGTREDNRRALIRFQNEDPRRSIYALYITPYYANEWRELLGRRVLKSRSFMDMEFDYAELRNAQCNFRIKAVYADGNEALLEAPYNLCQVARVQFGASPSANPYSPFGGSGPGSSSSPFR